MYNYYNIIPEVVSEVDSASVCALYKSILDYGYIGQPILYAGSKLITGNHRFAAIRKFDNAAEIF